MYAETKTSYGPWTVAWAGFAVLATANGFSRGLYARRLGDDRAHQVSTATLVAALLPYTRAVERRWPLLDDRTAAGVGAMWAAMTVAFEFGFGHYVARQSWRTLFSDYNMRRGRLWPLVLVAAAAAPAVARHTGRRPAESSSG